MGRTADVIVYEAVDKVGFRKLELAECGPDEIICETVYTFVSPGTELRVLGGHYAAPEEFPLIPGYSSIGKVLEVGKDVKGFRAGDLVSGRNPKAIPGIGAKWGGQASHHVYTTTGEDRAVLLPRGADPINYVITEVAAISLRGVDGAAPVQGETAVVIGQGVIGAFSAAWLMLRGCRVIVCDVDERRLQEALKRGVAEAVNMNDQGAIDRLAAICNGGADIVVESSGTSAGTLAAYKLVRKKPQSYGSEYKVEPITFYHQDWPRLVMQANYIEPVSINPFDFITGEGITILAPKDRGVEDRQKTIEAIRTGQLKSSDFIDAIMPFGKAVNGYAGLKSRKYLSVIYQWNSQR